MSSHRDTSARLPKSDPIAFFLTWPTYGTWLPGDERGWVEYRHGWRLPDPGRLLEASCVLSEDACRLSPREREIVEQQVAETCRHRTWHLHAVSCRSNHMHVVVSAGNTAPRKIRQDLKAWCTRRLREQVGPQRAHWWAERGSQRYIYDEDQLTTVVQYVREAQDRKHRDL